MISYPYGAVLEQEQPPRVVRGVARVAVTEIVLDHADVVPFVGERVAAGVAQCVRVHAARAATRRTR